VGVFKKRTTYQFPQLRGLGKPRDLKMVVPLWSWEAPLKP